MVRIGGLLSYVFAAAWAYKGEIIRALLYDRGFHLVGITEPGFFSEYGIPILLVGIGSYLFWRTGDAKVPSLNLKWPWPKAGNSQASATDWPIRELFGYLRPDISLHASSTVGRQTFDDLDQRWVPIGNEVIKQLSLGRLHAIGRGFKGIRTMHASPIPPAFWQTAKFTYWFLDRLGTGILHAKNDSGEEYADIEINAAEARAIWPEETWPDFRKWDKKEQFEFYEAACLWFNVEPRLPMPERSIWKYQEWRNETFDGSFPVVSESVRHAIDKAVRAESSVTPHTLIRKETLIGLAERDGYKPLFLYPYKRGEK